MRDELVAIIQLAIDDEVQLRDTATKAVVIMSLGDEDYEDVYRLLCDLDGEDAESIADELMSMYDMDEEDM